VSLVDPGVGGFGFSGHHSRLASQQELWPKLVCFHCSLNFSASWLVSMDPADVGDLLASATHSPPCVDREPGNSQASTIRPASPGSPPSADDRHSTSVVPSQEVLGPSVLENGVIQLGALDDNAQSGVVDLLGPDSQTTQLPSSDVVDLDQVVQSESSIDELRSMLVTNADGSPGSVPLSSHDSQLQPGSATEPSASAASRAVDGVPGSATALDETEIPGNDIDAPLPASPASPGLPPMWVPSAAVNPLKRRKLARHTSQESDGSLCTEPTVAVALDNAEDVGATAGVQPGLDCQRRLLYLPGIAAATPPVGKTAAVEVPNDVFSHIQLGMAVTNGEDFLRWVALEIIRQLPNDIQGRLFENTTNADNVYHHGSGYSGVDVHTGCQNALRWAIRQANGSRWDDLFSFRFEWSSDIEPHLLTYSTLAQGDNTPLAVYKDFSLVSIESHRCTFAAVAFAICLHSNFTQPLHFRSDCEAV
jgi:hypothetical protein